MPAVNKALRKRRSVKPNDMVVGKIGVYENWKRRSRAASNGIKDR